MIKPIEDTNFARLKADVESHPRLCGYYLVKLVDISALRSSGLSEEQIADRTFQYLDDQKWPPIESRPTDQSWSDYIVDRQSARAHAIEALIGGPKKGHTIFTIQESVAAEYFERFVAFFEMPGTFYIGMGFGSRDLVFQEGVAIISPTRAGLLWVVESD